MQPSSMRFTQIADKVAYAHDGFILFKNTNMIYMNLTG